MNLLETIYHYLFSAGIKLVFSVLLVVVGFKIINILTKRSKNWKCFPLWIPVPRAFCEASFPSP